MFKVTTANASVDLNSPTMPSLTANTSILPKRYSEIEKVRELLKYIKISLKYC